MANIFSPQSTYTYGQATTNPNAAYNVWGSQGAVNPYIKYGPAYTPGIINPNTGRPVLPLPNSTPSDSGGSDYIGDTQNVPEFQGFGSFGFGNNLSTSPGYDGPYNQGNPLSDLGSGFSIGGINFDPLGIAIGAINPLAGLAYTGYNAIKNWSDPKTIEEQIGVAEPVQRFSTVNTTDINAPTFSTGATTGSEGTVTSDGQGGLSFTSSGDGPSYSTTGTDYGGGYSGWSSGYEGGYTGGIGDVNGGEIGYESPGGDDSGGDSGGGGSYIATATTQALGEEGLKVFEDWRDYMFNALPTFTSSFGRYRVTAPKIVEEIDKKENSKEIYKGIWDKYLKPIFDIIKTDKDSKKALKDYKVMVRELSNKYLKGVSDGK